MKHLLLTLICCFSFLVSAQDSKGNPQITVSGEGTILVNPDYAVLNFAINTVGKEAVEVKNANDEASDKVLKWIKKMALPNSDYKTTALSLNRNYDYEKKAYFYQANQNFSITIKDLSKYEALMMGLIANGINEISSIEFKSSKREELQSEARKLAIKNAKHKAEDFASTLNQKVGKAIMISDTSQAYYPQVMDKTSTLAFSATTPTKETMALGQIEITASVSVSFVLE
ncbi:SIMPL domain-containing protein [Flavobacterium aciduliphilum]|uniref:Secreted protein n=1 Tax=Flavobacterium aciduliphilum TaxID=1101402 RepID=A0A328YIG9_9FLAO|nr:SIMPL domain-containing protein [Flavobacterium aciduliphilum]RAR73918.1 hypothetical protein CLV55_103242 [Flavobacterium aciduliphilum]